MKEEKIYSVEFNEYTNITRDTVATEDNKCYLHIPLGGLLVRESALVEYSNYGKGYKSIILVGSMFFKGE